MVALGFGNSHHALPILGGIFGHYYLLFRIRKVISERRCLSEAAWLIGNNRTESRAWVL